MPGLARYGRMVFFAGSISCVGIAEHNSNWERKLRNQYRKWYEAHEDYRRAVKLVSEVQSDKMKKASQAAYDNLCMPTSIKSIMNDLKNIDSSYQDVNIQIVKDAIASYQQETKSNFPCHHAKSEDINKLNKNSTSVEERDIIIQDLGLKNTYKSFAIAMASSREATARDNMLETLYNKPYTIIIDHEDYFLINTRYIFWLGFMLSFLSGTVILHAERDFFIRVARAILCL